jgi:hypothetical protein
MSYVLPSGFGSGLSALNGRKSFTQSDAEDRSATQKEVEARGNEDLGCFPRMFVVFPA